MGYPQEKGKKLFACFSTGRVVLFPPEPVDKILTVLNQDAVGEGELENRE